MVEWLSSIKEKDLNNCGKLVLTGDMSTLSITKVDLSKMNTLEGDIEVFKDLPMKQLNLHSCQKLTGSITPQMLDWLSGIKTKDLKRTNFVLSPETFLLLLERQADFSFFDTLSLPSLETMDQAPPDVIDRLNAIKEVDLDPRKVRCSVAGSIEDMPIEILYGCEDLTGNIESLKDMPLTLLFLYNCTQLTGNIKDLPQSITHLNLEACRELEGDIESLKDMPLTSLILYGCRELKGRDKAKAMFPNAQVNV